MKKNTPQLAAKNFCLVIALLVSFSFLSISLSAQNVAITDDDGYTADPSAMLDVKATNKGMLVPRLTTDQRLMIADPAPGLLLFDTDEGSFYFYDTSGWVNLSYGNPSGLFGQNGNYVFLNDTTYHFGVGTHTPEGKLEVKADAGITPEDPIFGVVNYAGDTVFAVYPEGVRIKVNDDPTKATSSKSGFAVGGFSLTKGLNNEYLRVTPDSVRVYIEDTIGGIKATSSKGGFAVGGFSLTKGITNRYLTVSDATTQVYVADSTAGFGVTNIESGSSQGFLNMTTQNYFIGHEAGSFISGGIYNNINGYKSGYNLSTGDNNVFLGYMSGFNNSTGSDNILIGYKAGYMNQNGGNNVLIGYEAGYNEASNFNSTCVGYRAGYETEGCATTAFGSRAGEYSGGCSNTLIGSYAGGCAQGGGNTIVGAFAGMASISDPLTGTLNILIGTYCGKTMTSGSNNIFLGYFTGAAASSGSNNVFLGNYAGLNIGVGSGNVFIGDEVGRNQPNVNNRLFIDNEDVTNTTSLIYGEFDNDMLRFNGEVGINTIPEAPLDVETNSSGYAIHIEETGIGTEEWQLGVDASGNLNFYDGTIARITFEDWGQVGIGTTAPTYKLDVAGNLNINKGITGGALYVNGSEALWYDGTYFSWGYGGSRNYFADKVGIGITTPSYKLELPNNSTYYYGSARAYSWATYSDSRVKKNQEELDYGIEELMKLVPKKYDHHTSEFENGKLKLNKDYSTTIGLIAQEVYKIIPEAAEKPVDEATDLWSLDYEKLIPVMINSIKELNQEVTKQKCENENLKAEIVKQNKEYETVKAEIESIKSILKASAKK